MKRQKPLPNPSRGENKFTVVFFLSLVLFLLFMSQIFMLSHSEIEISNSGDISRAIAPLFINGFSVPIFFMGMTSYIGGAIFWGVMALSSHKSRVGNYIVVLILMFCTFVFFIASISSVHLISSPNNDKAEMVLNEKGLNSSISYSVVGDFNTISVLEPMVNEFKDDISDENIQYDIFAVEEKDGDVSLYFADHYGFENVADLEALGTAQKDNSLAVATLLTGSR